MAALVRPGWAERLDRRQRRAVWCLAGQRDGADQGSDQTHSATIATNPIWPSPIINTSCHGAAEPMPSRLARSATAAANGAARARRRPRWRPRGEGGDARPAATRGPTGTRINARNGFASRGPQDGQGGDRAEARARRVLPEPGRDSPAAEDPVAGGGHSREQHHDQHLARPDREAGGVEGERWSGHDPDQGEQIEEQKRRGERQPTGGRPSERPADLPAMPHRAAQPVERRDCGRKPQGQREERKAQPGTRLPEKST